MKRNFLKVTATILAIMLMLATLASCDQRGEQGPVGPQGEQGPIGPQGEVGVGVKSIVKTAYEGLVDTYTITFSDGKTTTFTVTNGANGANGQQGIQGIR